MRRITLELDQMKEINGTHTYLATVLNFPAYYGGNLDALYDCLTDIEEELQLLVPSLVTTKDYLGDYGQKLIDVVSDAVEVNEKLTVIYY